MQRTELPSPDDAHPAGSAVRAASRSLSNFDDPTYWAQVCPDLHLNGDLARSKKVQAFKPRAALTQDMSAQLDSEGVVQVNNPSHLRCAHVRLSAVREGT